MRIDHCPKCKKAGLRYEDPNGRDADNRTQYERICAKTAGKPVAKWGESKWCPRCKEWVKPNNQEWIGKNGH
jgi:hypothetical protein